MAAFPTRFFYIWNYRDPRYYEGVAGDYDGGTGPVGQKIPNGFGLYDIFGNGGERILDAIADVDAGDVGWLMGCLGISYEEAEPLLLPPGTKVIDGVTVARGHVIVWSPVDVNRDIEASAVGGFRVLLAPAR